ncbi:MAG TPA: DUF2939 domain-containing protein [Methylomirabilota bacterium]|nr:DUF2939 domain-containing protein [Methylomirabilota bacterium]
MSRCAWAWGVPAAVLLLTVLGVIAVTSSPRYALYRLGAAVQRHDVAEAEGYFDVERIADTATAVIVGDFLSRQPAPTTAAEANGRELVANVAKRRIRPQVAARVRAEVRRAVERAGAHPSALVLPVGLVEVFRAFQVSREGSEAWVTYTDPGQGPLRFRMSRQPDRTWKISEFDPDWVRRRVAEASTRVR